MGDILCVIDGMTDAGFRVEDYPHISALPHRGRLRTVPEGRQPESLTCILTLLGYTDVPEHLRGYADALGAGLDAHPDDLVLRGSWVRLDEAERLCGYAQAPAGYQAGEGLEYHSLGGYQGLLLLPGMADRLESIVTCQPHRRMGFALADVLPTGCEALLEAVRRSRNGNRCLIPWGQSRATALLPFPRPAAVITGTGIVRGIARLTGMRLVDVPGATGDVDTDLSAKAEAALRAAEHYSFVLLHINGADEAAHRRDAIGKRAFIRKVDQVLLPRLLKSDHTLTVVADHCTSPVTGMHEGMYQTAYAK